MRPLREPLLHFLLIGLGLFLLFAWVSDPAPERDDRIVITAEDVRLLAEGWRRTWGRPPAREELDGLIDDRIREEILYREALALGLDQGDTIIRRRLRQKMEFLSEELAERVEPTDEQLQAHLEEHPDDFVIPGELSFRQVYVNPDTRGADAPGEARRLLARLGESGEDADLSALGDRLPLPHDYDAYPVPDVERLFGREFAARLATITPGTWSGPVESGYGLHLVLVQDRKDGRLPALDEVRRAVRRDWLAARRAEAEEAHLRALYERYTVVVERGAGDGGQPAEAGP